MDANFSNHLLFMRKHRGDFAVTSNGIYIVSDAPGFTAWVPTKTKQSLPAGFDAVRLVPSGQQFWESRLALEGFNPAETLSYQECDVQPPASAGSINITKADKVADGAAFAAIQEAAFLDPEDPGSLWWRENFPVVARRNLFDPDQDMLIAWSDEKAKAVLLIVYGADVAGIYAVATDPACQRSGFSTALLQEAHRRAHERGMQRLVLQAMAGSYADEFYKRRGFTETYRSTVWRRSA